MIDPIRIESCLSAMHHRGPDAKGVYRHSPRSDRHVLLLHTRLSIIDLDVRANQPMKIGPHVLTYNGELYNYRELRRENGWQDSLLNTESDTEVLLRLLARDGADALDCCEGMWALAFYDESADTLLLARDRFGEKPLYMHRNSTGFYFGSEIKFIHALLGHTTPINTEHLKRYLVNGYKSLYKKSTGFFRDIHDLPAATTITIDSHGHEQRKAYWHPLIDRDVNMSFRDAVIQTRHALIDSVILRLRSDVPIAFMLSGGVDSNALISIASRELGYDVHGFTININDHRYDEHDQVLQTVEELGIRHTQLDADRTNFLDNLQSLVASHDAPVYTITWYAHWLLMKQVAAHGYRVAVCGTGADELFTGYYDHHNAYLYEQQYDHARFNDALANWHQHIFAIVRNPHLKNPYLFIESPDFRDHIYLDAEKFGGCLSDTWSEPFTERKYCSGLLRNRMLNEMFHESVPPMLHEDDVNAMSQSIENRSPFLDRRLFELSQRIPTRHLIQNGYAKAVLREAMRGIVPEHILDERRKIGFNAPIGAFLDMTDPEVRQTVLAPSPIFDLVRRDAVENLFNAPSPLPNSTSKFLFCFLNAKLFLEAHDSESSVHSADIECVELR